MSDALPQPCENTDRELWREREGDYYADSIHVTKEGRIGINCGGHVFVMSLKDWHFRAKMTEDAERIIAWIANTSYRTRLNIPDHKAISQKAWAWICKGVDVTQLCEKHDGWCREQEKLMRSSKLQEPL